VSDFGWRKHPVYQDWRYHTGVDIGAPEGASVSAALSGKVVQLDSARELGLYVVIEHPNGIKTKYGHLTSSSVSPGDSGETRADHRIRRRVRCHIRAHIYTLRWFPVMKLSTL